MGQTHLMTAIAALMLLAASFAAITRADINGAYIHGLVLADISYNEYFTNIFAAADTNMLNTNATSLNVGHHLTDDAILGGSGDKFAPVCDINTYLSERPDMSGNAADEVAVYAEGPAHAAGLFNVRITESSIGTRSFMTAPPNAYAGAAGYAGSPYYRVM